jgi:hypothetical protein
MVESPIYGFVQNQILFRMIYDLTANHKNFLSYAITFSLPLIIHTDDMWIIADWMPKCNESLTQKAETCRDNS